MKTRPRLVAASFIGGPLDGHRERMPADCTEAWTALDLATGQFTGGSDAPHSRQHVYKISPESIGATWAVFRYDHAEPGSEA